MIMAIASLTKRMKKTQITKKNLWRNKINKKAQASIVVLMISKMMMKEKILKRRERVKTNLQKKKEIKKMTKTM